jgi:hypothetical protein
MWNPTRDQAREFLATAWSKYRSGVPLSGLETKVAGIVAVHPEYHRLLEDLPPNLDRDWTPDMGEGNPFLHLSLHLAAAEQLAIDQPPGIVGEFERLRRVLPDEHAALHAVIECLAETLWQAQRQQAPPDGAAYLDRLRRR